MTDTITIDAPTDKPKPKVLRGPGGKFLSKAEREALAANTVEVTTVEVVTEEPTEPTLADKVSEVIDEIVAEKTEVHTPTLSILTAIDKLVKRISENYPEVPHMTIVVGAKGSRKRGVTYGHFHANQWHGEATHELMISGENLQRGAEAVLGTLIHEAAHAIAHVRGVKDTSNNHRYHNSKFKEIAEGMGITLEKGPTIGWSITTLAEGTADVYRPELDELAQALTTYRKPVSEITKEPVVRNSTKIKVTCDCGDEVSVSKIWFEKRGEVTCGDCLSNLRPVE